MANFNSDDKEKDLLDDNSSEEREEVIEPEETEEVEEGGALKKKQEKASLDLAGLYLQEIGETPLLTQEQEVKLAKRIAKGDKKARKQMIESNLRLVVKMARHYLNCGLDLADLIEEGNLGLIHAVSKFDVKLGYRFSTYATWWIRHNIERAIMNQGRTVRLPVHVIRELSKYRRKAFALHKKLEHQPTDREIADLIDQPIEKIRKILSLGGETLSLDTPMFEEGEGISFANNLEDEGQVDPVTTLEDDDLRKLMAELIAKLDKQQYEVIAKRFGLENGERKTLDQVALEMGINREKVRQIQEKALRKLRNLLLAEGVSDEIIE